MLVNTTEDGIIRIDHLFLGHHIPTPEGERVVVAISKFTRLGIKRVIVLSTQKQVVFEKEQCFFIRENILELGAKLKVGDKILCKSGMVEIAKVGFQKDWEKVWLVRVNSLQNKFYLANGILVGWQNVRRRNR